MLVAAAETALEAACSAGGGRWQWPPTSRGSGSFLIPLSCFDGLDCKGNDEDEDDDVGKDDFAAAVSATKGK